MSTSRNGNTETQRGFLIDFQTSCIYLFPAVLDLHDCSGFPLVAGNRDCSLAAVSGLLTAVASRCSAQALGPAVSEEVAPRPLHRPNSCGAWASLLCGMWDLPEPEIEPMSPALAGGFFTAEPPGKSPSERSCVR